MVNKTFWTKMNQPSFRDQGIFQDQDLILHWQCLLQGSIGSLCLEIASKVLHIECVNISLLWSHTSKFKVRLDAEEQLIQIQI